MRIIFWFTLRVCILCLGTLPLFGITPNAVELEIANLAINHPAQARPAMVYDPILNLVARAKALDLAKRGYFAHVDPDGYGPNKAVQLAGYGLPGWWGDALDSNYIESIAGGYASAQAAFDGWMLSDGHRRHVLAETEFYSGQTRYGVGYAELTGSPYRRYYVFVTAPPNENGNAQLEPYVEWLFGHYSPIQIGTSDDSSDDDGDGISRLQEFVLQFNPKTRQTIPPAVLNPGTRRLEWHLPVRADLGIVSVMVEQTAGLRSWSTVGVQVAGGVYSIDARNPGGFLRLVARREE